MPNWLQSPNNPPTYVHALRTATAAIASLGIARLLHISEPYWAPISTLVVIQSNLGSALPISAQRFAGTVVGAAAGALAATQFPGSWVAFGMGILVLGVLAALLKAQQAAYRYACITLAIVLLIPRAGPPWVPALHRIIAVSLGIAVALALSEIWPEPSTK